MHRSRAEFFRNCIAQCHAAAQNARDPAIKQAYLELAQAWQVLADEVAHLRAQKWRPQIYNGHLRQRSLDDFYELRTADSNRRATKHAVEHPTLGREGDAAATGREVPLPRPQGRRARRSE
jgi:hypothetical protein